MMMIELIRTNDIVLIGFVEALLKEEGIVAFVADAHMSILEGSIGALQRRLMVPQDALADARRIVAEAGLAAELKDAAGQ
jgi:Putative prokaryotic signal transducing protein